MTRRRWTVAGLALVASLALGTAACQNNAPGTGSPSASAKSATEQLGDAAAKTKGQSFAFTLKWGDLLSGSGTIDGGATNNQIGITLADAASGMRIQADMRVIGTDTFLKLDLGSLGTAIPGLGDTVGKWMHIDSTKLPPDLTLGIMAGSSGILSVNTFISGVATAEKTSDTEFKGTIDLAKSTIPVGKEEIAKLPDNQRVVPFTAALDAQGRISKISVTMPKVSTFPAADLVLTYSDWGTAKIAEKPPAAETVEAPAMLYQLLAAM